MRSIRRFICVFLMLPLIAAPALAQEKMPGGYADLVEKLSPAVVNISTEQKIKTQIMPFSMPFQGFPNTPEMEPFREFFERFGQLQPQERDVTSLGSGFILDPKGYVVTNDHVINEAEDITVTLFDNTQYKAKVVGRDKKTDLVLLKVDAEKDLPAVKLGDSDAMRVGDIVLAIGNPYGLGGSVTQGIISARQRSINAGPFDDFLQTDAPINRGNSGGPLFNTQGEVIGINSAIFSPSGGSIGIGFAIPTALAEPVLEQLKQYGRTHRGWLGVKIQEVSKEIAESVGLKKTAGALVIEVNKGSPADKAGIEAGDIIIAFNGTDITQMRFLPRMVAETKVGTTVTLTYWRKNKSHTAKVTLGELDEEAEEAAGQPSPQDRAEQGKRPGAETMLGMDLMALNPQLRSELRLGDKDTGVAVVGVARNSEAAKRGVRPGDLITEVNHEPVNTPAEFKKAMGGVRKAGRNFALVKIARGKEEAFITLPTGEGK